MPITLGTNINSLRGQNRLNKASAELRLAYERLSSGQRINRATDDAAGLAVSENLKADSRIFGQALKNINDGISYLSIAETAVQSLSDILVRQNELATQAANGSLDSTQRLSLDTEAMALTNEYNRIIETATFAGRKIFNAQDGNLVLQHGMGESSTTLINSHLLLGLSSTESQALAEVTSFVTPDFTVSQGPFPGDPSPFYITLSTPTENYNFVYLPEPNYVVPPTLPPGQTIIVAGTIGQNSTETAASFVTAANATGVFSATAVESTVTIRNLISGAATDVNAGGFSNVTVEQQGVSAAVGSVSIYHTGINLRTQNSARSALDTIKLNFEAILKGTGNIGTIQSRLATTASVLSSTKINYDTAINRILSSDIAEESSKLVRNQILQQTASSILSQANLQPQLALELL